MEQILAHGWSRDFLALQIDVQPGTALTDLSSGVECEKRSQRRASRKPLQGLAEIAKP